jgi:polyhydroxyalkanoate synthesis repressor PhaR
VLDNSDALRYIVAVTEKPAPDVPRPIKRYRNRKLYDAEAKRYVTLEDLGAMIGRGHDLRVVDQTSGEDVTPLTLAQVVLEGIKQRSARIPRQVLTRLVRMGFGPTSDGDDWPGPQEAATRAREEAERIVAGLISRGRLTLEEALTLRQEIAQSVHRLVAEAQAGIEGRIRGLLERADHGKGNPSLGSLKGRLSTLETYLAENQRRPRRVRTRPRKRPGA